MSKWYIQKLGDLTFVKGGKRLPKGHDYTAEITRHPYLRVVDFKNNSIDVSNLKYLSNETASQIERYTISYEDVYISIAGTIGLVGTIPSECDKANLTENAAKLVIKDKSILDKDYLVTYLSSTFGQNQIGTKIITTTQPKLALFRIQELDIPLPPLEIQKQVARTLKKVSDLLAMRKQQIAELDNLIKSTFYDMFGDPVANEKGWENKKLGEMCDIVRGGSPRPIEKFLGGDIPWIKIGDATNGDDIYLNKTKEFIIFDGVRKSRLIPAGSMIFANCGVSLGFARIITFDGCIHDGWLAFNNISERLEKIFLLKQLNEKTKYFRKTAPSGTQPNLNTDIMKNANIIVPPYKLQTKFAEIVTKIEEQKALVKKAIDETKYLFDSLMNQFFE